MKKRIFSILLALCIIFSLMPVSVYANLSTDGQTSTVSRYTVLVIDVSGSMDGTPINTLKTAAKNFCQQVLNANGKNYVAIVTYSDYARTITNFTENLTTLQNSINNLYAYGGTNTNSGLQAADSLLSAIPDAQSTKKNVLLLSDGMPNEGSYTSTGKYTYNDYYYYGYANSTYNTATNLKNKGDYIYTLGFFHSLYGSDLTFARRFMNDLQNAGYYDVVDGNNLQFIFGEIAKDILKQTGKFTYASGSDRDYEGTYYYDDTYFFNNSYTYNESLATMSLCVAMSAFGSNEKTYPFKSDNARNLLEQVGFSDFSTNYWYTVKPTTDSIGVVAANKEIEVNNKPYTLIALAVRGGGYEQEWASNFTMGVTGKHEGFNEAKNNVISFLKDYINQNGITGDIKLWVTGYSRAAATSNLVAGAIDDGAYLGNVSLSLSGLYAYTFETPMGAVAADAHTNPVYKNIFNIVNPSDPVPKVAPSTFGFRRYGVDKQLPTAETDAKYYTKQAKMLNIYNPMESTIDPYVVDNFAMKKITLDFGYSLPGGAYVTPTIVDDTKNKMSQSAFLDQFITKLSKEEFKSRSNYVNTYQDGVREVFKVLNGTTDDIDGKQDVKWTDFKNRFQNKLKSNIGTLIVSTSYIGSKIVGSTTELVEKYAVESLNEAGITSYNVDEIHQLALTIASTIIDFAVSHPNYTATMILNIKGIGAAHYPELCLAWLQSMDKNYTTNAGLAFSNGSYRIIRINCPVDVEVYDASNNLVAAIKSDEPQSLTGSSIISVINEDGEKLIYLPASDDYNLKLIPTDSGKMTFAINEYSSDAGEVNRIINYYDITIKPGETFTSKIPAYSNDDITNGTENGSSTVYSLLNSNNESIAANVDLKGTDSTSAYYMVNVTSNNQEYGSVTGQGIRQLGNYAQITSTPFEGCKFDGWYINDQKVSSEAVYRFRVQSDVDIVAKFTKNQPPDVSKATASVPVIWSPDNKMTEIKIQNVTDPDGDPVTITITGITQDEPLTDKDKGDAYGIGTDKAWVRASRDGKGNGRVYKISFKASDGKGGESSGYVLVKVLHDQGNNNSAVDDGQIYNSVIK